jgi:deoxyribodipyrimidine photo-lyase
MKINIFWFRRDLRLQDNAALYHALKDKNPVLPIFIFDKNILDILEDRDDARVTFLHNTLVELKEELEKMGSTLHVFYDNPLAVFKKITQNTEGPVVEKVYTNHDYEPYALERDKSVKSFLSTQNIDFQTFKDHVIFEYQEVTKDDGLPYTVYSPYMRKWKTTLETRLSEYNGEKISYYLKPYPNEKYFHNFLRIASSVLSAPSNIPTLESMNFVKSNLEIPSKTVARSVVKTYDQTRNFPYIPTSTTKLGIHFRFGTISIREKALAASKLNETYLNELIWRDFYAQILQHFPHIGAGQAFRKAYDRINWRSDEAQFQLWCEGKTGYTMVDAGMRELNTTGYMHNRVRMIVSSFLTKHLLLDWRLGEAYFAKKLLDFDMASNNGGWQWAMGGGTDAAPYFRIFSPMEQQKKFDPEYKYVRKFVPEYGTPQYPKPIVDHKEARERCLKTYANALKNDAI